MSKTIRERVCAFWSGERPDQIPYTIYQNEWRHTSDDPAWDAMYENGLGVTWYNRTFDLTPHNVEFDTETTTENGVEVVWRIQRTPVGEIDAIWRDGWHSTYWLETPEDYRVMVFLII